MASVTQSDLMSSPHPYCGRDCSSNLSHSVVLALLLHFYLSLFLSSLLGPHVIGCCYTFEIDEKARYRSPQGRIRMLPDGLPYKSYAWFFWQRDRNVRQLCARASQWFYANASDTSHIRKCRFLRQLYVFASASEVGRSPSLCWDASTHHHVVRLVARIAGTRCSTLGTILLNIRFRHEH